MRDSDAAQMRGMAARFFRALFDSYDLHEVRGVYVAVPKGTPWFAGATLRDISWQIAGHGRGEEM
jgi:hypothetical protein